jgi:hypothetical protein
VGLRGVTFVQDPRESTKIISVSTAQLQDFVLPIEIYNEEYNRATIYVWNGVPDNGGRVNPYPIQFPRAPLQALCVRLLLLLFPIVFLPLRGAPRSV